MSRRQAQNRCRTAICSVLNQLWQPNAATERSSDRDFSRCCCKNPTQSLFSCAIRWDIFPVLHASPWMISSGSAATTIRCTPIWRRGCLSWSTAEKKHPFISGRNRGGNSRSTSFSRETGAIWPVVARLKTATSSFTPIVGTFIGPRSTVFTRMRKSSGRLLRSQGSFREDYDPCGEGKQRLCPHYANKRNAHWRNLYV